MTDAEREEAVIAAYARLIERAEALVAAAVADAADTDPTSGGIADAIDDSPCP